VAIPIDEGCGHFKDGSDVSTHIHFITADALGRINGESLHNGAPAKVLDTGGCNAQDSVIPSGTAVRMYVAAQRAALNHINDMVDVQIKYFSRWKTLAGSL